MKREEDAADFGTNIVKGALDFVNLEKRKKTLKHQRQVILHSATKAGDTVLGSGIDPIDEFVSSYSKCHFTI